MKTKNNKKSLLKAVINNKPLDIKSKFEALMKKTIEKQLADKQKELAAKYFSESIEAPATLQKIEEKPENVDVDEVGDKESSKPILLRPDSSTYRYMINVFGKTYFVDFTPSGAGSSLAYDMTFYVRNKADSDVATARYGITSASMIKPLFEEIVKTLRLFIYKRKPALVRLVPGGGSEFPSIFHMYIFDSLKSLQSEFKGHYQIFRKSTGDGAAFTIRRGAGGSGLQGKSFRSPIKSEGPSDK